MTFLTAFKSLKPCKPAAHSEGSLAVSLLIPAKNSSHTLENTLAKAHTFLSHHYPGSFEIILIPTQDATENPSDPSVALALKLSESWSSVKVCVHRGPLGKGAALRSGFLESQGKWIFFTDADLPYDLIFFKKASLYLNEGIDFVSGNRRLPFSSFQVPVKLLHLAYSRHRLGLLFNKCVRLLLPIHTTDTQAGIKAMSREFAINAFENISCPGFFFDLELFLTAKKQGFKMKELQVHLLLKSEKSTVRVFRESLLALFWLCRITFQLLSGHYG